MRTVGGATEKDPAITIPGAFPFNKFAEEIDRMLIPTPHSQADPAEAHGSTTVAQNSQFITH
jgi:hypothetical protein